MIRTENPVSTTRKPVIEFPSAGAPKSPSYTGNPIPASWSLESVTQCATFRYAPHIGKLPLVAALSPIL